MNGYGSGRREEQGEARWGREEGFFSARESHRQPKTVWQDSCPSSLSLCPSHFHASNRSNNEARSTQAGSIEEIPAEAEG